MSSERRDSAELQEFDLLSGTSKLAEFVAQCIGFTEAPLSKHHQDLLVSHPRERKDLASLPESRLSHPPIRVPLGNDLVGMRQS